MTHIVRYGIIHRVIPRPVVIIIYTYPIHYVQDAIFNLRHPYIGVAIATPDNDRPGENPVYYIVCHGNLCHGNPAELQAKGTIEQQTEEEYFCCT